MLIWGFGKVLFNIYGKKNLKLFNEGVDFLRDEDYEKALIIFKKLYNENFEINEVLIKLCFIYKELGDYKTSLKYINEYLILNPNSGRGLKYKKVKTFQKNGDLNYLDGTDGDPENLIKALVIISSFTGLSIIGDVYINNGHKDYENIANLNSTYSNFTLDVNYNKSDSKITLTRV